MRSFVKKASQQLKGGLARLHQDQSGQSLVFAVVTITILTFFAGTVYRIGYHSSLRMKAQTAADAAAYSMALTQANGLSAMAWINEGMAQVEYHLMRYAVDVITTAMELEFVDPRRIDPSDAYTWRQPDWNVVGHVPSDPNNWEADPGWRQAQAGLFAAYQEAYDKAKTYIPKGKEFMRRLNELQQQILSQLPQDIHDVAVDTSKGAAFAQTRGNQSRRGVGLATIYPDDEGLEQENFFTYETYAQRFGIVNGVQSAMHPKDRGLPGWINWFDAGHRGNFPGYHWDGSPRITWHYYDIERSQGGNLVRRTFARIGRLYVPYYRGSRISFPYLRENNPNEAYQVRGRGYPAGTTRLKVDSVSAFVDRTVPVDDATDDYPDEEEEEEEPPGGEEQEYEIVESPFEPPFYVRLQGAKHMGERVINPGQPDEKRYPWPVANASQILIVTEIDEENNELVVQGLDGGGLDEEVWIWLDTTGDPDNPRECQERTWVDRWGRTQTGKEPYCVEVRYGGYTHYYRRSWPRVVPVRKLIYTDPTGNEVKTDWRPFNVGYHHYGWHCVQTRGPCWDTREIRLSETGPGRRAVGPTGYIVDDQGKIRPCPTCGFRDRNGNITSGGADYDGDGKTDVCVYPSDTFYRQGTEDLDEEDFMDVRIFRDWEIQDDLSAENEAAYGLQPVDPPIVLTDAFFRWGFNAAIWMRPSRGRLLLPRDWENAWGYFALASARPAIYDRGRWIADPAKDPDLPDDIDLLDDVITPGDPSLLDDERWRRRKIWAAKSNVNLYNPHWQARLVHVGRNIVDFDINEEDFGDQGGTAPLFVTGLHRLLYKLIYAETTYIGGPTDYNIMKDAVANLFDPPEGQRGIRMDDPRLQDTVHH